MIFNSFEILNLDGITNKRFLNSLTFDKYIKFCVGCAFCRRECKEKAF